MTAEIDPATDRAIQVVARSLTNLVRAEPLTDREWATVLRNVRETRQWKYARAAVEGLTTSGLLASGIQIGCARCGRPMIAQTSGATIENNAMEVCSACSWEIATDTALERANS